MASLLAPSMMRKGGRGMADVPPTPEDRIKGLEPLLSEVSRRADKMGIDDNDEDFTITIDAEMWRKIKDFV